MGIPWLAAAQAAFGCGGFFCNSSVPVDQSGEVIVFEVSGGTVTAHVQVQYQGSSEKFAWVLPASGVPTVSLSTNALFTRLLQTTAPQPSVLYTSSEQDCAFAQYSDSDADTDADADADADSDGVEVLSVQSAGPYEAVVLDASSTEALVSWLDVNGYDLPDTFGAAAAPYLTSGMNFLALRLAKDASAGTLQPLSIRWSGEQASIPLTLTGIAATPDMPVTAIVLGPSRAVPLSYLHVQLNPLVYDWFDHSRSYDAMVGRAADEAGGRAFATTFARPTSTVFTDLGCGRYVLAGLAELAVPLDWFQALDDHGFTGDDAVLDVLRRQVPAPAGVEELSFYNDPLDYPAEWAALQATFDPVAATTDLDVSIVTPCTTSQEMLERSPFLTRLSTTLSPDEMTVDPVFGFNPDLPEVLPTLESELHRDCATDEVSWRLPGGYEFRAIDVDDRGRPTEEWIEAHLTHAALVVEQLGEVGLGTVIADHRPELEATEVPDPEVEAPSAACGCGGGPAGVGWALAAIGARRARRRVRAD